MTKEEVIEFWKIQLTNKILLSPTMEFIIKQTVRYLEAKDGGTDS